MEGNNAVLEENNVLLPEGNCEARNDASHDVQQFGGSVELVGLVDEGVEALVHRLSDHLSSGDQL